MRHTGFIFVIDIMGIPGAIVTVFFINIQSCRNDQKIVLSINPFVG